MEGEGQVNNFFEASVDANFIKNAGRSVGGGFNWAIVWRSRPILRTGAGRINPAPTSWNNSTFIHINISLK